MKILFAGTPEIAVPSLDALAVSGHEIVGVLTSPDRPTGRGRKSGASAARERATSLGLPILQPERLGSDVRREVAALGAELLVCVAYGRIFGPKFLSLFKFGGINLHPSLLPKYRGPAPIPAAILAGDAETGVTIQELAPQMDAGDILAQVTVPLSERETTQSLTQNLSKIGAQILTDVVECIASGTETRRPQNDADATYTGLIRKSDGEIDWSSSADAIERAVRAYNPWPLAFTTFDGQRLNILDSISIGTPADSLQPLRDRPLGSVVRVDTERGILVETGNGQLALTELQLQSRKALGFESFLNGVHNFVGAVLGG